MTTNLSTLNQLEPKAKLSSSVRGYFCALYFTPDAAFRNLLASVGNKDSITGNRLFDRHQAVGMIKAKAEEAGDSLTVGAKDGDIYKHIVSLLKLPTIR